MGILDKFRPKESPKKDNHFLIFAGFFLLVSGLTSLFLDPTTIFDSELMLSGWGFVPVPTVLLTLTGWVFFGYGILNRIDWFKYEDKLKRLKRLKIFGKMSVKNKCFILLSIAFFTTVIFTFIIVDPVRIDRTGEKELINAINELQRTYQRLDTFNFK